MMLNKTIVQSCLVFLFLIQINSCQYYRIGSVKTITPEYVVEKEKLLDYIIVHVDNEVWNLNNTTSENDLIKGIKDVVSPLHNEYMKNESGSKKIYK